MLPMDGLPNFSATNAPERVRAVLHFQKMLWLAGRYDNREIVKHTSQPIVLNQVGL